MVWPLACAGVALGLYVPGGKAGQPGSPYLLVESTRADLTAAERGGERFPAGSKLWLVSREGRRQVSTGFYAAADPDVSFDAKRVLFAGRESAAAAWRIYEATLPEGTPKPLSTGSGDCIRPVYLPDGIAYARKVAGSFQVERLKDGEATRLTYAPGNWLPSQTLADGRILMDGPHVSGRDIYTLYSDGTGIETVRCDHSGIRRNGRQLAGGDIVFETKAGAGRFTPASATAIAGGERANHVPVEPRPVPKRHPVATQNKDGANLMSLDVYTTKLDIPSGSVARVRVYSDKAPLGEAPVESDGSFYVHVPSETPLRFELLDQSGKTVAAERTWMWTRRGEQRICVGCHAGPERAPENAVPKILTRDTNPVDLAGGRP